MNLFQSCKGAFTIQDGKQVFPQELTMLKLDRKLGKKNLTTSEATRALHITSEI